MSEQRSQPEQGAYPGKLEKDHTAELSGEGFVALSQRRRKQFSLIFLITLATMIIVLATFGGTILWRYLNMFRILDTILMQNRIKGGLVCSRFYSSRR